MSEAGKPSNQPTSEEALDAEMKLWRKHEIDPMLIGMFAAKLDAQVQAMYYALIELGVVEEEKMNDLFRKKLLEILQVNRPHHIDMKRQALAAQISQKIILP